MLVLMRTLGITNYNLEQQSYNYMDFRIPDVSGYQPIPGETIIAGWDNTASLLSALPLPDISEILSKKGYNVAVSTNPGRYICNYIYFKSLLANNTRSSVFVHVPQKTSIPIDSQVDFVKVLIDTIVDQALQGNYLP